MYIFVYIDTYEYAYVFDFLLFHITFKVMSLLSFNMCCFTIPIIHYTYTLLSLSQAASLCCLPYTCTGLSLVSLLYIAFVYMTSHVISLIYKVSLEIWCADILFVDGNNKPHDR